jgi:hypothetical protein
MKRQTDGETNRWRDIQIETDEETDRQMKRQADRWRQTDKWRQTDGCMEKQRDRWRGRQTDEETDRQMKRQTVEEKTDRGRDRKIDGKTQIENCSER